MKLIAIILLSLVANVATAATYQIDKEGQHAYVIFRASHLGYSYIIGHFEDFEGRFTYDPENVGASQAAITIQTASLDSDHAERDKHLRDEEYFDASGHPEITFVSTGYEGSAESGVLKGDLTLKGVTRSIEIAVEKIGEGKDPWGGYRAGFEGNVTLNAADYGLPGWIGDVAVELIIEGIRQ